MNEKIIAKRNDLLECLKVASPIIIGYIPLGMISGVLLKMAGVPVFLAVLMSVMVFAGSGQFIAASMISIGATPLSIIGTIFVVNFRYFLMSLNLSMFVEMKSKWKRLWLAHVVTDEIFAVNYNKYTTGEWSDNKALVIGIMSHVSWVVSNGIGAMLGNVLKVNELIATFVLISMFITLVVIQVGSSIHVVVAILSISISIMLYSVLRDNSYIVISSILAAGIGAYLKHKGKKAAP